MNSLSQPLSQSEMPVSPGHFKTIFKDIDRLWYNEETGSEIYKAKHKLDGCPYAVKKIRIPKEFETDSKKFFYYSQNELKILTQFNHQNIVKYHNCWIEEEELKNEEEEEEPENSEGEKSQAFSFASDKQMIHFLYIQMEYCAGGSLAAYLRENAITPEKAKQIFIQILQGMKEVHSQKIIHRDLKPENIFVDEKGEKVKIGDFGLSLLHELEADTGSYRSKLQSKAHTQSKFSKESNSSDLQLSIQSKSKLPEESKSSDLQFSKSSIFQADHAIDVVGTPLYSSPEQLTGKKYGKETDIFALGLIFYEILGFPRGTDSEKFVVFKALREEWDLEKGFELKFPLEASIVKDMTVFYPSKRAKIEDVLLKLTGVYGNGSVAHESHVPHSANLIKKFEKEVEKEDEKEETLEGTFCGKGKLCIYVRSQGISQPITIEKGLTSAVLLGGNQNKGRKLQFSFQGKDRNGMPINPTFVKYLS